LTRAGFRCFATDLSGDPVVGLGAAKAFDGEAHAFERAVASLTRWPFRDEAADVAVCNASLHYLREIAPALREAHRVLRPGGALFILNSPVHRDPGSASKAAKGFRDTLRALGAHGALVDGHRHFIVEDLERELRSVYSAVRRHEAAVGMRFRLVRLLKRIALRTELASFPIYEARRGKS
jgi:ubiquinone/menaquinone biosynthesis C-methylase UbiE